MCYACDKVFSRQASLTRHAKTVSACNKRTTKCLCSCGSEYTRRDKLQQHQKICQFNIHNEEIKRLNVYIQKLSSENKELSLENKELSSENKELSSENKELYKLLLEKSRMTDFLS